MECKRGYTYGDDNKPEPEADTCFALCDSSMCNGNDIQSTCDSTCNFGNGASTAFMNLAVVTFLIILF